MDISLLPNGVTGAALSTTAMGTQKSFVSREVFEAELGTSDYPGEFR
jgi:hypothetical protein